MNVQAFLFALVAGVVTLLAFWAFDRWLAPWLARRNVNTLLRNVAAGKATRPRQLGLGFLAVCLAFTGIGAAMILAGDRAGWWATIVSGLGILLYIIEPLRPGRSVSSEYRVVVTGDVVACEHPKRSREAIRWEDVRCVSVVTTSDGPWRPEMWLLFEGPASGCSIPTEAEGFDQLWDQLSARFSGFDFKPFIEACGKTTDARHICWQTTA